jgi:hypothetical protein
VSPAAVALVLVGAAAGFWLTYRPNPLARLLFWLAWAVAVVAAGFLLSGCSTARAEPKPDAYLVITPTSTTLAEPGYVPQSAGPPPAEAVRR